MTTFTTITEKELLCAAWFTLIERENKEFELLQANPLNPIARTRYNRIHAQCEEIHARILELEQKENEQ